MPLDRRPDRRARLVPCGSRPGASSLPLPFTKQILARMRRAGIVAAQRGGEGGYRLGPPPGDVAVADIVRAVEGPLADVRGEPPEDLA